MVRTPSIWQRQWRVLWLSRRQGSNERPEYQVWRCSTPSPLVECDDCDPCLPLPPVTPLALIALPTHGWSLERVGRPTASVEPRRPEKDLLPLRVMRSPSNLGYGSSTSAAPPNVGDFLCFFSREWSMLGRPTTLALQPETGLCRYSDYRGWTTVCRSGRTPSGPISSTQALQKCIVYAHGNNPRQSPYK
ncbi:hypothetical protein LY76DRAFT_57878 [Colletotrichum caudatum]|nr:hypothetical protein LY76DRAFT_57878 [Colletotrichum caudatum]